jgi:hypothetical protein
MLIAKAVLMKPEFTYSKIIGPDGKLVKEALSPVFSGGQYHDPVIIASPSGGMTPELFHHFIDMCVLPCFIPTISPENPVLALWESLGWRPVTHVVCLETERSQ